MKLLLDTHTFIWWNSEPSLLSDRILQLLLDQNNIRLVSVVSLWEIQIKAQLGKLVLRQSLAETIESQSKNGINFLEVRIEHILELEKLPFHHKDPFDRLLISQTRIENAVLLSRDRIFSSYSVNVQW